MKKSLIFAGMLVVGFANAQYEGKVGVNTETPKATLEVQPTATNLSGTTNEGIIAPKLSKERIAAIATPVEGTLVYATDETTSPISAYTGSDTKVAKITEKGYYFYNGTEWVKTSSDIASQIWQKQADNKIQLVDSDIENNIYYSPEGNHWNVPKTLRSVSYWNSVNKTIEEGNIVLSNSNTGNTAILNLQYADKVQETYSHSLYKEKQLSRNVFYIDANSNWSPIDRYFTLSNSMNTTINSTRNITSLYSAVNNTNHFGTGQVTILGGGYNRASLYNGSASKIVAVYNQVSTHVSSHLPAMEGTYNFVIPSGTGTIDGVYGTRNFLRLDENSSNAIKYAYLSRSQGYITNGFTGTINHLYGFSSYFDIADTYTGLNNQYGVSIGKVALGQVSNYGIKIEDVGNSTATQNFAIHTGTGKIRLGDLANASATADRVVTVDKDGVLKTGEAVTNTVKLATTTSVTCDATTTGTMNFGTVNINGKDTEAFGFCMKNSAGEYKWYYIYGGAGITTGSGAFGTGL